LKSASRWSATCRLRASPPSNGNSSQLGGIRLVLGRSTLHPRRW
jgi:hypothetical protein